MSHGYLNKHYAALGFINKAIDLNPTYGSIQKLFKMANKSVVYYIFIIFYICFFNNVFDLMIFDSFFFNDKSLINNNNC